MSNIADFLENLLVNYYNLTNSYGIALFLLLITYRVVLFPLTYIGQKYMIKNQSIAPEQQEINKKYMNDPAKRTQALLDLYEENNMSKYTTLFACLPMLLSYPLIIALYSLLRDFFEGSTASILWIDAVGVSPKENGSLAYLALPFLVMIFQALSIYITTKVAATTHPDNPTPSFVKYLYIFLILMIGLFSYNSLAVLSFYWIMFSMINMVEQVFIKKVLLKDLIIELKVRRNINSKNKKKK